MTEDDPMPEFQWAHALLPSCTGCRHWREGCTIPEDELDHRGEPAIGRPKVCRYFEGNAKQ